MFISCSISCISYYQFDIKICCNRAVAIRNSHMFLCYFKLFLRSVAMESLFFHWPHSGDISLNEHDMWPSNINFTLKTNCKSIHLTEHWCCLATPCRISTKIARPPHLLCKFWLKTLWGYIYPIKFFVYCVWKAPRFFILFLKLCCYTVQLILIRFFKSWGKVVHWCGLFWPRFYSV